MPKLPNSPTDRYDAIDALRGFAMVWMTLFHFCFDLSHFGWWRQDFYSDPVWTWQRTAIVSLFLFCAGLGQAVAQSRALGWSRFFRRWGRIVACALLVTLGSWLMFPRSFIYFGVLHGMAVMLLIARLSAGWGRWLWPAGLLALLLPLVAHSLLTGVLADWANPFDARWLNWLGLISRKPITEDYVPVLPWLGVLWWGMAAGEWMLARPRRWLAPPAPAVVAPLALLGRWSLSYYMLHQPVMIGALLGIGWLLGRSA
ncbi:MAG: DUF1624 domain-containing protein [Giesbergeria sp.]